MKALFSLLLIAFATVARADGDDHDRARELLARHEILPLAQILPKVQQQFGGHVIDIDFEAAKDGYHYEIVVVAPDGRVRELIYDAKTGELVGEEGKTD